MHLPHYWLISSGRSLHDKQHIDAMQARMTDAAQTKLSHEFFVDGAASFEASGHRMLSGRQIRAGLGLIGRDNAWLATATGVSRATIDRAVRVDDTPNMRSVNMLRIQRALEAAGCLFLDAGDLHEGGEGVRQRPRPIGRSLR